MNAKIKHEDEGAKERLQLAWSARMSKFMEDVASGKATENDIERKNLLEKILKGNILSMLKGLGIHLENEILISDLNLSNSRIIFNKGIGLMSFDADFKCNVSMPNNIGLGKNSSIGHGIIRQVKEK